MTRRIGPYEVLRELGRGGMGVVYEVTDPALPRRLALKLLFAGSGAVAEVRFEREVELLARVRHPGVVAVHAVGRAPEGAYVLMDLVEGEPLAALAARGLDAGRAVAIVRALCDAVEALHAQGVIHRDLKPQNVIVRPDGAPVLLDFGVARDAAAAISLTQTGQLVGTPRYMAPEQAEGKGDRPHDRRTDVYGLGAVLFHLLAQAPPFAEVSGGLGDALAAILEGQPRWPAAPRGLGQVLRRAMARRPEDRYPTAAALGAALEAAPLDVAPSRRLRWLALAAAVGTFGGGAVAAWIVAGAARPSPPDPPPSAASTPAPSTPAPPPMASPAPPAWRSPLLVHSGPSSELAAGVAWVGTRLTLLTPGRLALLDVATDPAQFARVLVDAPTTPPLLPCDDGVLAFASDGAVVRLGPDLTPLPAPVWPMTTVALHAATVRADRLAVAVGRREDGFVSTAIHVEGPAGRWDLHLTGFVKLLSLSKDGGHLACGVWVEGFGRVDVIALPAGRPPEVQRSHELLKPAALALLDDGALVIGDVGGQVSVLTPEGDLPHVLVDPGTTIGRAVDLRLRDLVVSPDGARAYTLRGARPDARRAPEDELQVWDLPGRRLLLRRPAPPRAAQLALSPDGELLAVAARGRVELWRTRDLEASR
ncbi:MAG: serine/threonine protein kinase [Planctomycetes bacterium]|nr:serine/threonine protein kinase [Planctomycetota bacterium]